MLNSPEVPVGSFSLPVSSESPEDPVRVASLAPVPVFVAEDLVVVAGLTDAEEIHAFWQFSKFRLSVWVPLPRGHSVMQSIVRFCLE